MSIKCDLKTVERISKKGSSYTLTCIKLYCDKCGVYVDIEDFSSPLPVGLTYLGQDVTLDKKVVGNGEYLMIKELDYSIPYKYKMAVNLLACHKC